jgi:hypothetical protein
MNNNNRLFRGEHRSSVNVAQVSPHLSLAFGTPPWSWGLQAVAFPRGGEESSVIWNHAASRCPLIDAKLALSQWAHSR